MPEPPVPSTFEWVSRPWGLALQCRPLAEVAEHVFTARQPRLSGPCGPPSADANADVAGGEPEPASGWREVAASLGLAPGRLATLRQVHGADVVRVPDDTVVADSDGAEAWGEGDALVTSAPDIGVAVKVADCVPILLADRMGRAVAAVHAGWRGTAVAVVQAAVRVLAAQYGITAADLLAAIGPSIGPCCYEVGTDVHDTFLEAGARPHQLAEWFGVRPGRAAAAGLDVPAHPAFARVPHIAGKLWLDTWRANEDLLLEAGVPRAQIWTAGLCTKCHADRLHSYRADGARAGRMAAAIRRAPRGGYVVPVAASGT